MVRPVALYEVLVEFSRNVPFMYIITLAKSVSAGFVHCHLIQFVPLAVSCRFVTGPGGVVSSE